MKTNKYTTKSISELFAKMPRKSFEMPNKESLWLRITPHVKPNKPQVDQEIHWSYSPLFFFRYKFAKIGVTALLVVLAVFIARGAAVAMPGETLYQVKKAAEQVEKVVAISDEAKVKVNVRHAKRRIAEVRVLVIENKDEKIVKQTLAELKSTTEEVVAATTAKPELKTHVAAIALELDNEESGLLSANPSITEETKAVLQTTLSETIQSITKLLEGGSGKGEAIKGITSKEAPTSTPAATAEEPTNGNVQSGVQVDRIIESEPDEDDEGPIILDEPTKEF